MAQTGGHIDPDALQRSLRGLRRRAHDIKLKEALGAARQAALRLFDVSGTGLMVIDGSRALCSVAATDEAGRVLEESQERVGHGPCVDALVHNTVIQVRDRAEDDRWPVLKPEVPDRGVRAILGVPVRVAGKTVGALNCYIREPHSRRRMTLRLTTHDTLLARVLMTRRTLAVRDARAVSHRRAASAPSDVPGLTGADPAAPKTKPRPPMGRAPGHRVAGDAASGEWGRDQDGAGRLPRALPAVSAGRRHGGVPSEPDVVRALRGVAAAAPLRGQAHAPGEPPRRAVATTPDQPMALPHGR